MSSQSISHHHAEALRSRAQRKRTLFSAIFTIALSLLTFGYGIEERGGRDAKDTELTAVYGMNLSGSETAGVCSAFLVTPELLFTAAHCVYNYSIGGLSNAPDINRNTRRYSNPKSKKTAIFPTYKKLRKGREAKDPILMQHDFAYIRLKSPVTGVTPLPIRGLHELPDNGIFAYVGKPVRTVGYGVTRYRGKDADYSEESRGVKRFGAGKIEGVSSYMFTIPGLHGNILPGDSGGPLMLLENGQWSVIGVNQSIAHKTETEYDEGRVVGLRRELVCWAERDSGVQIPGAICP